MSVDPRLLAERRVEVAVPPVAVEVVVVQAPVLEARKVDLRRVDRLAPAPALAPVLVPALSAPAAVAAARVTERRAATTTMLTLTNMDTAAATRLDISLLQIVPNTTLLDT